MGTRFSHNYIARGNPTNDSVRARKRIGRLFSQLRLREAVSYAAVELELGINVPYASYGADWDRFFAETSLTDFLDSITVVSNLVGQQRGYSKTRWIDGVGIIFQEENIRYRIDDTGSVHFAIDGEYARNEASAVAALQAPRYAAARSHFEAGQRALDATPPLTREAIRQTFEAAETVFKLMFTGVTQLGASEITKKLRPHLEAILAGTEKDSASMLIEAFKSWVNSAHPYRHGQGVEAPDNPGLATAVLSVSMGASFVRWLAELDAAVATKGSN